MAKFIIYSVWFFSAAFNLALLSFFLVHPEKYYKELPFDTFVILPRYPIIKVLLKNEPQKHQIDVSKPITALVVPSYGRLGNNINQVMNALSVAIDLSVKKIYVSPYFWFINTSLKVDGFVFSKSSNFDGENYFLDKFFYRKWGIIYNQSKTARIVSKHFESVIPKLNISSNKLIIHIRSGDIFGKRAPAYYAQPPLCFYTQIIQKFDIKDVEVYTEDDRNPVVGELKKMNIEINYADLGVTVAKIFYSRNMMIGFGTFAVTICRISSIPKNIYLFGELQSSFSYMDSNFNLYLNKMTDEFKRIIYPWHNSVYQRIYMTKCRCSIFWTRYNYDLTVYN